MSGRDSAPRRNYGGRTAEERRVDRRERLLATALDLFGTRGYTATSIERLCSTASVSTRNFYEEFSGREELLTALYVRINEQTRTAVAQAFADAAHADLPTRAARVAEAYVEASAGDRRSAQITFVEVFGVSQAMEQHRLQWREDWSKDLLVMIEDAVARGEAVERDYRLTVVAIIGAANSLVHLRTAAGRDLPLTEVSAELTRLILALLTAPDAR